MASIYSVNKNGSVYTFVYLTDTMGTITYKAEQDKDGAKRCFVKNSTDNEWKPCGIENFETIVSLSKYQING